jgi:hypothetical protein
VRNADELLRCVFQYNDREMLPSVEELNVDVHVGRRGHRRLW